VNSKLRRGKNGPDKKSDTPTKHKQGNGDERTGTTNAVCVPPTAPKTTPRNAVDTGQRKEAHGRGKGGKENRDGKKVTWAKKNEGNKNAKTISQQPPGGTKALQRHTSEGVKGAR